ncbi:MAG: diacylglycerol/polyprenol kinase family protein [Promethearchaeota archaeon]
MVIPDLIKKDLIITTVILIYLTLTIFIPKILKEKNIISKYSARKIIHSFSGLAILITPYLTYTIIAAIIALLMTFLTRESKDKSKAKPLRELFAAISEEEELKLGYLQGPFAYCLSITVLMFTFTFFPSKFYFPISAILIMMFADTSASFIGRKYGKHHIYISWVGTKRTIEGSVTFFTVALACSLISFFFYGRWFVGHSSPLNLSEILLYSFTVSVFSTILELISPSKYDDLIIPLGSTIFLVILALICHIW